MLREKFRKFEPNTLSIIKIVIAIVLLIWGVFTYIREDNYQYAKDRAELDPDAHVIPTKFPLFHGIEIHRHFEPLTLQFATSVDVKITRYNDTSIENNSTELTLNRVSK